MGIQLKSMTWSGRVIAALVALALLFSASMKFLKPPAFTTEFVGKFGFPEEVALPIAITEVVCVILYLVPQTAVLGAVLLTGYLGGAIVTHVRLHDNFVPPVIIGVLVWLALFLKDGRIRALLPIRWVTKTVS